MIQYDVNKRAHPIKTSPVVMMRHVTIIHTAMKHQSEFIIPNADYIIGELLGNSAVMQQIYKMFAPTDLQYICLLSSILYPIIFSSGNTQNTKRSRGEVNDRFDSNIRESSPLNGRNAMTYTWLMGAIWFVD